MTDWKRAIRDVPDFPAPGILFRDLTPLWDDPGLFAEAVRAMAAPFSSAGISKVLGIEARGFIFGPAVALELKAGFIPARKAGKLPGPCERVEYALEYGKDALEVRRGAISRADRCLVVDDVLATGGTAGAAANLAALAGGEVAGLMFFIELAALGGRRKLAGQRVESIIRL